MARTKSATGRLESSSLADLGCDEIFAQPPDCGNVDLASSPPSDEHNSKWVEPIWHPDHGFLSLELIYGANPKSVANLVMRGFPITFAVEVQGGACRFFGRSGGGLPRLASSNK
ncbi:hypothetical protein FH972_024324 [Carpinus fangiana]|uniref:Uncharacterized protein n=1 Tax=Carpinus fangiana TaxID=176857 RepID=A0A5N6L083_9ROSI|nr:hypothetical protein FH972_024324 [Carpinus fangiana]